MDSANRWNHNINYEENPLLYTYSEDCGGMYTCNPYKKELLKIWKFLDEESSRKSANDLYIYFLEKIREGDFVGADLAKKYILAGSTRKVIPVQYREVFANFYFKAKDNKSYNSLKVEFLEKQKEFKANKKK
tara:strand:- start:557 stop:952 length:396 start_codon:yes stop_codon:yes gene_type:complete